MYCVGISLNARDLKAAVLKREKGKLSLDSLQAFPLEAVKLFYTLPPFQSSSPVTVASGLSGSDVLTRRLQLPLENKRKILAALPFQLEAILPYPCESALICSLIYPMRAQTTPVTVLATTVESLQTHLSELKKIEIQTDVVCCDPVALARFSHWQFPEELRILGLHVEGNQLLYVLREAGEVVLSQTLEFEGLELELEKLSIFLKQKGLIDDQTPWVLTGKIEQEALFRAVFREGSWRWKRNLRTMRLRSATPWMRLPKMLFLCSFAKRNLLWNTRQKGGTGWDSFIWAVASPVRLQPFFSARSTWEKSSASF